MTHPHDHGDIDVTHLEWLQDDEHDLDLILWWRLFDCWETRRTGIQRPDPEAHKP
jgi:hypothetical protein